MTWTEYLLAWAFNDVVFMLLVCSLGLAEVIEVEIVFPRYLNRFVRNDDEKTKAIQPTPSSTTSEAERDDASTGLDVSDDSHVPTVGSRLESSHEVQKDDASPW